MVGAIGRGFGGSVSYRYYPLGILITPVPQGQGGAGMLGTQDTLPGAGGPRLPPVLPFAPLLEQERDQERY